MSEKIDVLGIRLDSYTAKDAIKAITDFIKEDTLSLVEVVTAESVMRMAQNEAGQRGICAMNLILPGDRAILEAADVTDEKLLHDAENKGFVKMLFQYLHKNSASVFLLADTKEEVAALKAFIEKEYMHIKVAGAAEIPNGDDCDDMVINMINGTGAECILANVASDRQEYFICRCKDVLNVKLWVGISQAEMFFEEREGLFRQFITFVNSKILKRKAILEKKKRSA